MDLELLVGMMEREEVLTCKCALSSHHQPLAREGHQVAAGAGAPEGLQGPWVPFGIQFLKRKNERELDVAIQKQPPGARLVVNGTSQALFQSS